VAAFRATLEGIDEAQLLLHLVDVSHPAGSEQIRAVETVLGEIGVLDRPRLLAWNKIDLPSAAPAPRRPPGGGPEEVRISARTGEGLATLLAKIDAMVGSPFATVEALVPYDHYALVSQAYEHGSVNAREDTDDGVRIRAAVPDDLAERLRAFPLPRARPPRAASAKRTAAPSRAPGRKPAGKPGAKAAKKPAGKRPGKPARSPAAASAKKPAKKAGTTPARKPPAGKRTVKSAGRKSAGRTPRLAAKRRRSTPS
jgi:hypothetical protein